MNFRLLSEYHADIKKLIKISLPILLAQIAQNSMGLADTIMAGLVIWQRFLSARLFGCH